jgi:competence protein ComFA
VQQVLRYASYFDFLIIDEADAFPLNNNLAMWSWLKRAAISHTKRLVVTATPLPSWLKNVFRGEMPAVFLPVRYHGQPLPLPKIFYVPRIRNKLIAGEEIQVFKEFCARVIATKGEGLIFVPRQELIPLILYALKAYATCIKATGVSASDIARSTKVAKLYKGKLNFMVTTTLLERGVTFPRCHVLVMWAEYFTHRALIQMAGRVRRKHSYQLGQVFFLTERITKDQVKVIKELTLLNKQARKAGFLK